MLHPLKSTYKRSITRYLSGVLIAFNILACKPALAVDEIVFYNLSFTPSLQALLKEMVERALDLTIEDYGPYHLNYIALPSDLGRLCKDSQEGNLDIFFTAHRPKEVENCGAHVIETSLLNKAMGLRLITIHKDNVEQFSQIQTLNDLRKFSMGIGHNWEENKILAKYNLPREIAILNSSLLPMLEQKRFGYLATSTLDKLNYGSLTYIYNNENLGGLTHKIHTNKTEDLITLDDFFIYYPIPIEIHLSQRNPKLSERLKEGAKRFAQTGEGKKIIDETIKDIKLSKDKTIRLLLLDNYLFDDDKNKIYKERFLSDMPKNITILAH
ncbi:MAG: hypothetical protein U5M23_12515 [Marinagarivorans sp.]|nr:hypothetical protein [Marinagarivorans sp.]